ncbi:ribonuclease P protein component [Roseospira marina]|uniref:Ribonuclease P protein component n=2 Tax=Roseospira marina TaxID=140057 RepID=A0A5M6IGV1_9PROT|nr:ribonuclease P protein component [Roseospira marina]
MNAPASSATETPPDTESGERPDRLKRRGDFLRVAGGRRKVVTAGFILQAAPNPAVRRLSPDAEPPVPRLGFTCSRKVGKAVVRNRARRRLRAAADAIFPGHARPGWDYVLIGRQETNAQAFARLLDDLERALRRVVEDRARSGGRHGGGGGRPPKGGGKRSGPPRRSAP